MFPSRMEERHATDTSRTEQLLAFSMKRRRQLLDVVKLIESHCRGSHSESIHIWIWNLGRLNRPSHSPRARRPRPYSWLSKFTTMFLASTHNGAALTSALKSNLHLMSVTGKDTDELFVRNLILE